MFGSTALQVIQRPRICLEAKLGPSRNCAESSTDRNFNQLVLNLETWVPGRPAGCDFRK